MGREEVNAQWDIDDEGHDLADAAYEAVVCWVPFGGRRR